MIHNRNFFYIKWSCICMFLVSVIFFFNYYFSRGALTFLYSYMPQQDAIIQYGSIIWEDPIHDITIKKEAPYDASQKQDLNNILKIIFDEWVILVAQHTDNKIISQINYVATGRRTVIIDILCDENVFDSGYLENIFLYNIFKTVLSVCSECRELYILKNGKPFPFKRIAPYVSQEMIDSCKSLSNINLITENKSPDFVALLYDFKGNIFEGVFEKNIYQRFNKMIDNKDIHIIIPEFLPDNKHYYSSILKQTDQKKNLFLCFLSCFYSSLPVIIFYMSDYMHDPADKFIPMYTERKSSYTNNTYGINVYKKLKQYCKDNNVQFIVLPGRHKTCYQYVLGESIAIEFGMPSLNSDIMTDIIRLISSISEINNLTDRYKIFDLLE